MYTNHPLYTHPRSCVLAPTAASGTSEGPSVCGDGNARAGDCRCRETAGYLSVWKTNASCIRALKKRRQQPSRHQPPAISLLPTLLEESNKFKKHRPPARFLWHSQHAPAPPHTKNPFPVSLAIYSAVVPTIRKENFAERAERRASDIVEWQQRARAKVSRIVVVLALHEPSSTCWPLHC